MKRWIYSCALGGLLAFGVQGAPKTESPEKGVTSKPALTQQEANASKWLAWSLERVTHFQAQIKDDPSPILKLVTESELFLKGLDGGVALKNLRHFADLQHLGEVKKDLMYLTSRHALSMSWDRSKLMALGMEMEEAQLPAEDRLMIYRALGDVSSHVRALRQVYELYERSPELLKRPVPIPPPLPNMEACDIDACHDVFSILDIILKQGWRPSKLVLEKTLLGLAHRYEALKATHLAKEVLRLAPESMLTETLIQEKKRIDGLQKKPNWQDQGGDLY
jgi:hypothetical protein